MFGILAQSYCCGERGSNLSAVTPAALFNTGEQSFLENAAVFLATVTDRQTADARFRDDLQGCGIYKFIVLKRYKHTAGASEQRGWEVADRKPNKTFSSSHFYLPLTRLLIFVGFFPPATFCAIFNSSMPCNSICSHLINKVNRYLKQRQPHLCTHINFSSSVVQLILRMTGI